MLFVGEQTLSVKAFAEFTRCFLVTEELSQSSKWVVIQVRGAVVQKEEHDEQENLALLLFVSLAHFWRLVHVI